VKLGGSNAVILPADWFRTFKISEKQKVTIVYGKIALIIPIAHFDNNFLLKELNHLIDQLSEGEKG